MYGSAFMFDVMSKKQFPNFLYIYIYEFDILPNLTWTDWLLTFIVNILFSGILDVYKDNLFNINSARLSPLKPNTLKKVQNVLKGCEGFAERGDEILTLKVNGCG